MATEIEIEEEDGLCVVPTLDQFLRLPEIKPALEFVRGRIEQKMSPNLPQSIFGTDLPSHINAFARPTIGRAFVELRCSFAGESYVPDVSFFCKGRLPRDDKGHYAERVLIPPDLTIEILSPRTDRRIALGPDHTMSRQGSPPRMVILAEAIASLCVPAGAGSAVAGNRGHPVGRRRDPRISPPAGRVVRLASGRGMTFMPRSAMTPPATDPTRIFEHFRNGYATDLLTVAVAHLGVFWPLAKGPKRSTISGPRSAWPNVPPMSCHRPASMGLFAVTADGRLGLTELAPGAPAPGRVRRQRLHRPGAEAPACCEMVERLRTNRPPATRPDETPARRSSSARGSNRPWSARRRPGGSPWRWPGGPRTSAPVLAGDVPAATGPRAARRRRRHRHLRHRLPAGTPGAAGHRLGPPRGAEGRRARWPRRTASPIASNCCPATCSPTRSRRADVDPALERPARLGRARVPRRCRSPGPRRSRPGGRLLDPRRLPGRRPRRPLAGRPLLGGPFHAHRGPGLQRGRISRLAGGGRPRGRARSADARPLRGFSPARRTQRRESPGWKGELHAEAEQREGKLTPSPSPHASPPARPPLPRSRIPSGCPASTFADGNSSSCSRHRSRRCR